MDVTKIYIVDSQGKFTFEAEVENVHLTGTEITVPPPQHDPFGGQIAIWKNGSWTVGYSEEGAQQKWKEIRLKRNQLLVETDWTQLKDVNINFDLLNKIGQYRQALRDITQQNINEIVWPENPLKKDK